MQTRQALVVDDSRVARMTLSKLLQASGFDVIEQASAELALAWLQETDEAPDIIFMDVMLTGMDGLAATRRIKADPVHAGTPVVICTGKETEADQAQARAAGAVAVLSKPPAADSLQQILAALSPDQQQKNAGPETPTTSLESILSSVREHILPEFENRLDDALTRLQQQFSESKETTDSSQSQALAAIRTDISESLQQQFEMLKQTWQSHAEQSVSDVADQALATAIDKTDLRQKLSQMLDEAGSEWLSDQAQILQQNLNAQMHREVTSILSQQLPSQVEQAMATHIAALSAQRQTDMNQLKLQLQRARHFALSALAIAVVALILAIV
jgi:CheY-like chemotaxis protein